MSMWDPVSPSSLFKAHLPSTMGLTGTVTVSPNLENPRQWTVTWKTVTYAAGYIIYASPTPTTKNKFKFVPKTQSSVVFEIPIAIPDDYMFYFWVAAIKSDNTEQLLQDEPVYTTINSAFDINPMSAEIERDVIYNGDSTYYVEEMRRRNLAVLEYDGEDFYLYIKRWFGQPCKHLEEQEDGTLARVTPFATMQYTDLGTNFNSVTPDDAEVTESKDPGYQAPYRCMQCFGTGIVGGYFPRLRIRVRYGGVPRRSFAFEEYGLDLVHNFNSWTIWHPKIKESDFLVRNRTGERFLVSEVGESEFRGIPLHQEFNAVAAPRQAIIYDVSDNNVMQAIQDEGTWDIAKWDWSVWS